MIELELGNFGSEGPVNHFRKALEGKSYFNFKVSSSSMMGNWPVSVLTDYQHDGVSPETIREEAMGMIILLLATHKDSS